MTINCCIRDTQAIRQRVSGLLTGFTYLCPYLVEQMPERSQYVLAESEFGLVGVIKLVRNLRRNCWTFAWVDVHSSYRRQGVMKAMLAYLNAALVQGLNLEITSPTPAGKRARVEHYIGTLLPKAHTGPCGTIFTKPQPLSPFSSTSSALSTQFLLN